MRRFQENVVILVITTKKSMLNYRSAGENVSSVRLLAYFEDDKGEISEICVNFWL